MDTETAVPPSEAPHSDPLPTRMRVTVTAPTAESLTEETMKTTLAKDKVQMKMIPILWEGYVRRKGDWLPRWEELYLTMDGVWLRFYESKAKYQEAQELEEKTVKVRMPIGSPPHLSRRSSSQRFATFSTLPLSSSAAITKGMTTEPTPRRKALVGEKKNYLTATSVNKENAGRVHGFCVTLAEKKPLHLAVDMEIERVVWIHLLTAALEQQKELEKRSKTKTVSTSGDVLSTLTTAALWRLLPPGVLTKTLVGTPILVNLVAFYDAWGRIQSRKGNFAELLPCVHPNVTISSNYPPSVPVVGEYHGRAGVLCFFTDMHAGMDVALYSIDHMARNGDLAVVTGWETIRNGANGRKFRHLWKHELRFEADGRISHINIIADKVAAAVAFAVQTLGPSLELPHEQEESSETCPPGEIRVVCIRGQQLPKKKPLPSSADVKVVLGLNSFPHLTLKAAMPHKSLVQNGVSRVYSTTLSKACTGANPRWAETLSIQFSGAVPGTSTCLYVEVWQLSMIGDELIGCAKVNLAQHLVLSTGTDEDFASCAIPKWYELRKPEAFASSGGGTSSPSKRSSIAMSSININESQAESDDACGRIQLSISFQPYVEELKVNEDDNGVVISIVRTPRHRKSFDRLLALHEETEAKQKEDLEKRSSSSSSLSVKTQEPAKQRQSTSGAATTRKASSRPSATSVNESATAIVPEEMYTFTVASTKFRVYTRYQLIRAIGHGAYGVVIAASDQITGNSVAIKNIPKTFDDLVDAKRIVREIRLMRHLRHPNVVTVIDLMRPPSLKTFDDTYIVTDLMETDLHRVINSQEVLSPDHIAYITYQMLCGLRYIHSAKIIHRDIKPSNILINRDCLVKICDFGLARGIDVVGEGDTPSEQALTEYVVTRWYRSPELLLASKYTTAIDVWSIGCILVEMFTRKPLFPGHDHVHQLNLILQLVGSPTTQEELGFISNAKAKRWMLKQPKHTRKSFSSVCANAPPDAFDLITKLLEFDPRKRISVEDAIAHPFLSAYRKQEMEAVAAAAFDFSFEIENGIKKQLDKDTLRRLIFEDVCYFHPEACEELEAYDAEQARLRAIEEQERELQQRVETSPRTARAGMA